METRFCPSCGRPMGQAGQVQAFQMGNATAIAPGMAWEKREPTRAPSLHSDVGVPLAQASVTALAATTGAVALGGVEVGLVVGSAVFAGGWLTFLMASRRTLWKIEELFGVDLDGDGHTGRPSVAPGARGRGVIASAEDAILPDNWDRLDGPTKVADMHRFAEVCWERQRVGVGFGQKALRGWVMPSGFELTDDLHREFFAILKRAGLARRRGMGWQIVPLPRLREKLERCVWSA